MWLRKSPIPRYQQHHPMRSAAAVAHLPLCLMCCCGILLKFSCLASFLTSIQHFYPFNFHSLDFFLGHSVDTQGMVVCEKNTFVSPLVLGLTSAYLDAWLLAFCVNKQSIKFLHLCHRNVRFTKSCNKIRLLGYC